MVTRKQIKEYGATDYLARALTKLLSPAGKQGNSLLFQLSDVIKSIDAYVQRHVRQATKTLLQTIRAELVKIDLAIAGDDPLEQLAVEILEEDSKFKQAISESKQREREFYQTHGDWIKQNLVTHNNIVAFSLQS
jgi:hypothetical protein